MEFAYTDEASVARAAKTPIVALESTIITHGMPYPQNIEMAREVEAIIRSNGATPATIAVLKGKVHIGLSAENLRRLADTKEARKLSRADLATCLAQEATGATTVAATMILANLAGISVFATGGIGGVHRGAESSFDISADLVELSETPVNVVGAGPKAILDLPKTLEVLETLGVPVWGYQTEMLPAFWSRSSGLPAPLVAHDAEEIAKTFEMRRALGLKGGQLIANPIPKDAEIPKDQIDPIIEAALKSADAHGITAKSLTPYLLDYIYEATKGASLTANIALVKNNARLAAEIAKCLSSAP